MAHGTAHELPVRYRTGRSEEKQRIARAAAELVEDGTAVGLTGGTTTTEVARVLAPRTTSPWSPTRSTSQRARGAPEPQADRHRWCRAQARPTSSSARWPITSGIYVDLAFVGVDGIDAARGITTENEVEAVTAAA